jgi:hypothetical protein
VKENLAKLFYDMAKIVFGTSILVPIVQGKTEDLLLAVSLLFMVFFVVIGVLIDTSKENDNGTRN